MHTWEICYRRLNGNYKCSSWCRGAIIFFQLSVEYSKWVNQTISDHRYKEATESNNPAVTCSIKTWSFKFESSSIGYQIKVEYESGQLRYNMSTATYRLMGVFVCKLEYLRCFYLITLKNMIGIFSLWGAWLLMIGSPFVDRRLRWLCIVFGLQMTWYAFSSMWMWWYLKYLVWTQNQHFFLLNNGTNQFGKYLAILPWNLMLKHAISF